MYAWYVIVQDRMGQYDAKTKDYESGGKVVNQAGIVVSLGWAANLISGYWKGPSSTSAA